MAAVPRRASDEELLAGILLMRIERWLEQEGVFDVAGFGDVELAGELDWVTQGPMMPLAQVADSSPDASSVRPQ
jgi:hypothetical protein